MLSANQNAEIFVCLLLEGKNLLLKRIATPPLELEQELNRDLRPHSADHTEIVFSVL